MGVLLISLVLSMAAQDAGDGLSKGTQLLRMCESKESLDSISCSVYIMGVFDMFAAIQPKLEGRIQPICIPDNISVDQVRKIFVKYANDNPDMLHLSSALMVMASLDKAFNCRR